MSAERSHISPTLCPEGGQIRFMVPLGQLGQRRGTCHLSNPLIPSDYSVKDKTQRPRSVRLKGNFIKMNFGTISLLISLSITCGPY
jgi:hypothetical protein